MLVRVRSSRTAVATPVKKPFATRGMLTSSISSVPIATFLFLSSGTEALPSYPKLHRSSALNHAAPSLPLTCPSSAPNSIFSASPMSFQRTPSAQSSTSEKARQSKPAAHREGSSAKRLSV